MGIGDLFNRLLRRRVRVILEGADSDNDDSFYVDVGRFWIPLDAVAVKINGNSLKYVGMLNSGGDLHVEKKEAGEILKLSYPSGLSSVHVLVTEDNRVFYDVRRGVKVSKDSRLLGFLSRMVERSEPGFDFGKLFDAYCGKA